MSFIQNYLDEKTGDVKVNITNEMHTRAAEVIKQYIISEVLKDQKGYRAALDKFKQQIKIDNPHWEIDIVKQKLGSRPGIVEFYENIDSREPTMNMQTAMGKVLNDVLAVEAEKQGLKEGIPRPFQETNASILKADNRGERPIIKPITR